MEGLGLFQKSGSEPDSVELDRVDVDMPAHIARRGFEEALAQFTQMVLERLARRRLHHELRALEPGAAGEQMRNRIEDMHFFRGGDESGRIAQKPQRGFEPGGLGAQRGLEYERRKPRGSPFRQLGFRETREVVALER